ncbi:SDR family NAD(P)-dependent oxidoreductase [Microbacterium sp. ARD31]|uniref:SDR family NAD(P)-dependent oxidoreductase n=1 Tax=Microbacterium sp. ARD31 TaxID=2962576 RepID=UPI0037C6C210
MTDGLTLDLSGKTAVVTGSTQGIGLAIARRLAEAGADVVINGRNEERVSQAVASLGGIAVRGVAGAP